MLVSIHPGYHKPAHIPLSTHLFMMLTIIQLVPLYPEGSVIHIVT